MDDYSISLYNEHSTFCAGNKFHSHIAKYMKDEYYNFNKGFSPCFLFELKLSWESSEYLPHTLMQEASENEVTYAFPHESYNTARYKNQWKKYTIIYCTRSSMVGLISRWSLETRLAIDTTCGSHR